MASRDITLDTLDPCTDDLLLLGVLGKRIAASPSFSQ